MRHANSRMVTIPAAQPWPFPSWAYSAFPLGEIALPISSAGPLHQFAQASVGQQKGVCYG